MKIQLTAFRGKLRSEYMDWPPNTGPRIKLYLDMERFAYNMFNPEVSNDPKYIPQTKLGTFEDTGAANVYTHPDGTTELVRIYTLVDIN